jgi:hypothetical protein
MRQEGWTCAVVTSIEQFYNELISHVGREQLRASMDKGVQLPLQKRPPTAAELTKKRGGKKRMRSDADLEKSIRIATQRLNKLEEADRSWAAAIIDRVDGDTPTPDEPDLRTTGQTAKKYKTVATMRVTPDGSELWTSGDLDPRGVSMVRRPAPTSAHKRQRPTVSSPRPMLTLLTVLNAGCDRTV